MANEKKYILTATHTDGNVYCVEYDERDERNLVQMFYAAPSEIDVVRRSAHTFLDKDEAYGLAEQLNAPDSSFIDLRCGYHVDEWNVPRSGWKVEERIRDYWVVSSEVVDEHEPGHWIVQEYFEIPKYATDEKVLGRIEVNMYDSPAQEVVDKEHSKVLKIFDGALARKVASILNEENSDYWIEIDEALTFYGTMSYCPERPKENWRAIKISPKGE